MESITIEKKFIKEPVPSLKRRVSEGLSDQSFEGKRQLMPFLKRIFTQSFRYRKWSIIMIITVMMVAMVDSIFPLLWSYFLDDLVVPALQAKSQVNIFSGKFLDFIFLFSAMTIFNLLAVGVFIYATGQIQERVLYDLRNMMFNRLQQLSFSYYDRSAIGWLISRISSDTDRVAELISWGFLGFIWGVFAISFSAVMMFLYSWKLAVLVMLSVPLMFLISMRLRTLIVKYSRLARKLNSDMTASYNENINGVEVNKSTAQEEKAGRKFSVISLAMRNASFKASFYSAIFFPMVIMVGSLAVIAVIYFGGKMSLVTQGAISIGTLAAFFSYARFIFEPITDITNFYAMAQNSLSAGERIFSLIDEQPDMIDHPGAKDFDSIKGEIEFADVTFGYGVSPLSGGEGSGVRLVLKNFNLKIKAGESIALVGPTGEGKTTITSLVCRFYEPQSGKILIDGNDFREKTLHSYRDQLGVILQTPHLFNGTIRENIVYGKLNATQEEIETALKMIGADDFISRLDEPSGAEGANLSSGEKQLIAFARVILKNPRILIMDEATSSVDTIAEAKIQKGISKLIKGRTSIIIAHRLSTIRNCNRILVIKQGKIEEEGTHEELMKLQGHYYQLYTRQTRK